MVQNRDFEDEKAAAASEKVWDLYYQRIGACPSLAGRILYYWDTLAQGNREDGPGMKLWVFRKEHI